MNTEIRTHGRPHRLGEGATHPSEPRCDAPAVLLHVASMGTQRRLRCGAHPRLQAWIVPQADSRLSEYEVSLKPCYTLAALPHRGRLGRVQLQDLG
jgi:hypothetical protein